MQQLFPHQRPVATDKLYEDVAFPAGEDPYVILGMAMSLDGAVALGGTSGGIGGKADRVAFRRLRDRCDVILVGAGTVRAEDYGPPSRAPERMEERQRVGLAPVPQMVVVTASLQFDLHSRLFTAETFRPIIAGPRQAAADRKQLLRAHAEVIESGDARVDMSELVGQLRDRGLHRILCEGGPQLNNDLLDADLVDEIFVTVAPLAVGGAAPRMTEGQNLASPKSFSLVAVHTDETDLLLRYRRRSG